MKTKNEKSKSYKVKINENGIWRKKNKNIEKIETTKQLKMKKKENKKPKIKRKNEKSKKCKRGNSRNQKNKKFKK